MTNRKPKSSFVRKRRFERKRSEALNFETLERRELLATVTVGNVTDVFSPTADTSSIAALVANDGGDGISLREAVTAANNTVGEDAITFDAAAFTGGDNNLIRLTQGQLTANDSLSIDGVSVGGVLITGDADGDDITVFDSNITDVEASFVRFAGAADDLLDDNSRVLDFSGSGDLTLTGLTITGGRLTADDVYGGGIRFNSTGTLSLDQSKVSGNSTSGSSANGGGIFSAGGNVSLTNSTISFNSAQSGGGIYSVNGVVSLTNSTISGNNADLSLGDDGGGIFSFNGVVSLTNSTIAGNRGNQGGGIFSDNGVVFLSNSTINENSTSANNGGGIYISNGNLSLSNSTVSGNTSNRSGGGISSHDSTVLFVNSTVTANTARFGAGNGILFSADDSDVARLTIHNSIVADNVQGGNFSELSVTGDVTPDDLNVENSLIGRTYGSLIDATTGTGNILDQSALLSPLADYGGATLTHAPLRGSPAVDAGSNALAVNENGNPLTIDQRGESRVLGTVDIGAFELGAEADFETQSLLVTSTQDVVDPTDGLTSLREAIQFANDFTVGVDNDGDADGDGSPLDTITFDSSVFTGGDNNLIRLTQGQLEITDSLAINGSSVGGVVVTGDADADDITVAGTHITDVSASFGGTAGALADLLDDNSRVFDFTAYSGRLTISELTITGGRAREGNSFGYELFDSGAGGGIRAYFGASISLTDSTVSGNSAIDEYRGDGGGIFAGSGRVTLTNSTVSGNRTGRDGNGGGIFGGYISLTNSIVTGNSTGELGSDIGNGEGGGIFSDNGSVAVNNSIVSGNSSVRGGGGIDSSGKVSLANSTVSGNSSGDGAGGILARSGGVSLNSSAVSGNVAGRSGGGIQADYVSSTNSTISKNTSAYSGGGISAGDVFLTNSTVNGNVAGRSGGGIYADNVSLTGSTVSGNISRSRYGGGGISSRDGNVSLTNSTVSGNASDVDGGGIRADGSTVLLVNSTVTGNSAAVLGGGIRFGNTRGDFSSDESLTLYNSIVASNGDDGTAPDIFASLDVMNVEHSLIGDTTGFGITATTGTGNILNQLPLLGPLADNGGRTQTHVLLAGSPALNAGSNAIVNAAGVTTDQRGEARIEFGTVDIGAVEVGVETSLIVTTNLDVEDQTDGLTSLREAIALANSNVGFDTIAFAPSIFDGETTITITSQLPTITDTLTITGLGANLLTIDAQGGGDNVLDGDGFRIFEVNDGDSTNTIGVSISGLTLTGGDNSGSGGAVSNFENLTLAGVEIVDNRAQFGGGISNELSGVLSLSNSTIANNQASQDGGGISSHNAFAATNVTISGNSAVGYGAAIISTGGSLGSAISLTNVTLTDNSGNVGVYFNNVDGPTIATLNNSIIDNLISGVGSYGTTLIGGYNLFASADPGITGVGNLFNETSFLEPLADNGGPTLTHALLLESPANNAGGNALARDGNGNLLLTDQRGERRNQFNTVDIGAVENEFDTVRSLFVTTSLDVDDPRDGVTSLREAIAFAEDPFAGTNNDGDADGDGLSADTITFDASVFTGGDNSVIRLTQGELLINASLGIDGASVGGVVITGDANDDDVTLAGTNITDISLSSIETLDDNSRVLNFSADDGELTLTGLTITGGNSLGRYSSGGGILFVGSSLTLNQSIVSGNSTSRTGGGISAGDVSLNNSTVSGNVAALSGGGISARNILSNFSTISKNISSDFGGGIHTFSGNVSLTNTSLNGNISRFGGGIYSSGSYVSLVDSTVSGNISGGIRIFYGGISLSNSTVSENISDGRGGGISSQNADVFVTDSTIIGNSTTGTQSDGGGVFIRSGDLSLTNSTVSGNISSGSGGGITAEFGDVALTNSTVSGNNASSSGGGISSDDSTVLLVNSTVTGNTAVSGGGIILISEGDHAFQNSIVAGNVDNGAAPDLLLFGNASNTLLVENSLIGDTTGSGITDTFGRGNILNQSALLGPLADNGGPTLTHALLPGSPAIDAGNEALAVDANGPLTTDQRGVSRLFDARGMPGTGIDIGAFELRGLFVDNPIDEDDGNIAGGDLSLREAIRLATGESVVDLIAFDGSVFAGGDDNVIRLTQGELVIEGSLNIDGTSVGGVVITGDADGDDAIVGNTNITDVSGSFGGTAGAVDDLLDDNSRVINFSVSTGDLTLAGLTITGGRTTDVDEDGGGIRFDSSGILELNGTTLSGNSTTGVSSSGGGIHSNFGDVSLINSTLSGNSTFGIVSDGGAINTSSGDVSVISSTLSGNSASGNYAGGGGIHTNTGGVTLINSMLSGSRTSGIYGSGGGIFAFRGDVSLVNSTLSGNSTTGPTSDGGGIGTSFGNVSVVNSTLNGNSVTGVGSDGGGISTGSSFNDSGNSVSLVNSTLTGNSAFGVGGGVFVHNSIVDQPLTISNSIVAGNFDNETFGVGIPNDLVPDPDGVLTINHSLIGVADNFGTIVGDVGNLIGTQASPFDPMLGPLADNGGPTLTQALLLGSPAIDAGSNALAVDENGNPLTTDQRGENRFLGTVDIGAFELIEVRSLVVTTSQDIVDPNDGLVSLREAIAAANDPTAGINNDGDADGDGLASDTITFEGSVFFGDDDNVIRLTQGELVIGESLSIDASSVGGVLITGDTNDDDVTLLGTEITNLSGSPSNLLDDNSRVLDFSGLTGNLTLTNLTVTGGRAGGLNRGGGIRFVSSGTLRLSDSTIIGNSGYFGGGVYTDSGSVAVASSTISGNSNNGYGAGGGIYSSSGNVSVTNSTISGNNSYGGGGIRAGSGIVSLNNSTISGNSTRSFDGVGAISTVSGNISVTNSTISGNSNVDIGGGISTSSGNVSVVNSTIVGNSGGGVSIDDNNMGSSLRIVNSIVAANVQNSANSTPLDLVLNPDVSLTINRSLIGVGDNLETTSGNLIGTQATPLDPRLGPLADNGGSTLTHALLPGSPAIGAGNNALAFDENGTPLTTDQRGENRFVETVDIGAVESEFEDTALLGDTNLNGEVDFDDIAQFISLLATNSFLNEADIDRDGEVTFDDIGPFITLLADGGSAQFSSNLKAPVLSSATVVMSEANAAEPPVSSLASAVTSSVLESSASVGSTVEASVKTKTSSVETVAAKPAVLSPDIALKQSLPQASLVFVSDSLATPVIDPSELSVADTTITGATPIDGFVGPVTAIPANYSFLSARNLSFRGVENNRSFLTRRTLARNAQSSGFLQELRDVYPSTNVSTEDSFSTAAELFDANPKSLDGVFDFEFEEAYAGLIE